MQRIQSRRSRHWQYNIWRGADQLFIPCFFEVPSTVRQQFTEKTACLESAKIASEFDFFRFPGSEIAIHRKSGMPGISKKSRPVLASFKVWVLCFARKPVRGRFPMSGRFAENPAIVRRPDTSPAQRETASQNLMAENLP